MIVLITGATAGFGAEMARTFVKNGYQAIITGRREDRLKALADELGENCLPVRMDMTDRASVEDALAEMPQSWRQVEVLINNAGLALGTASAQEAVLEDW